jgi:hypothetical protein
MTETETQDRPYRDAIRWGLLIAAVAVTGFRLARAYHDFREWRRAPAVDPAAADFYRLNFEVDVVGILIVLCVGLGLFYLLRSPARSRR